MIERSQFTDYFAKAEAKAKEDKPARKGSRFERYRVSRIMAIQALFESVHNDTDLKTVLKAYLTKDIHSHQHPIHPDREFFTHLMTSMIENVDVVDHITKPLIQEPWSEDTMDSLLLCIIKAGVSELVAPIKPTKPSILICEYVEITKGFLDDKDAGYVNKALDQAAKTVAKLES